MNASRVVYALSFGGHGALFFGLSMVHVKPPQEVIQLEMEMIEREKKEEEKKEEPQPDPLPEPKPRAAPPAPAPAAPAPEPAPDFGFKLGPSDGGPGGVAVAAPKPAPVAQTTTKKVLEAPKAAAGGTADVAADVKAKPIPGTLKQPAFTDDARDAGIEGKVRLELTIDESGVLVEVKILEGLGHGLDEAAIATVRAAQWTAAIVGGRPVRSTLTIGVRFVLP